MRNQRRQRLQWIVLAVVLTLGLLLLLRIDRAAETLPVPDRPQRPKDSDAGTRAHTPRRTPRTTSTRDAGTARTVPTTPRALPSSGDWDPASELPHVILGEPALRDAPSNVYAVVSHNGFDLGYDTRVLAARWTSIKVTSQSADANSRMRRPSRFKADDVLASRGLRITHHDDYDNPPGMLNVWDRGHLVPFDDARGWGDAAGTDSFFTSNIVPQNGELNRGAWLELEQHVTAIARKQGVVWVVTGPIYPSKPRPFATGRVVPAPEALYKIVLTRDAQEHLVMFAWTMPNEPRERTAKLDALRVSVDAVEQRTGIDFFPSLSPELARTLEADAHAPEP